MHREVKETIKEHEEQTRTLLCRKSELEKEVKYLKNENTEQKNRICALEKSETELQKQKDQWNVQRITLLGETKWLSILKRRLGEQNSAHEKEIKTLKRNIYLLQTSLQDRVTELRDRHQEEIDTISGQHDQCLQNQGRTYTSAMNDMQVRNTSHFQLLQQHQEAERETLTQALAQLSQMNSSAMELLVAVARAARGNWESLDSEHSARLQLLAGDMDNTENA